MCSAVGKDRYAVPRGYQSSANYQFPDNKKMETGKGF